MFLNPLVQWYSLPAVTFEEMKIARGTDMFLVPLKRVTLSELCAALAYVHLVVSWAPQDIYPCAFHGQCGSRFSPGKDFPSCISTAVAQGSVDSVQGVINTMPLKIRPHHPSSRIPGSP